MYFPTGDGVPGDRLELSFYGENLCSSSPYSLILKPGYYRIRLWGGKGGGGKGGLGGYTSGNIAFKSTFIGYLFIGAQGSLNKCETYGGGGIGGKSSCYSGGGASDLRLLNDITEQGLRSRIMVAGGGGAIANWITNAAGGSGGGVNGSASLVAENAVPTVHADPPSGGSQTSGGIGFLPRSPGGMDGTEGSTNGTLGRGGSSIGNSNYAGGGGGGYYGGASSSDGKDSISGGSGGSSYVSGLIGCNSINENGVHTDSPNHYSGFIFHNPSTLTGQCDGNGHAEITYLYPLPLNACLTVSVISTYRLILLILIATIYCI